MSRSHAHTHDVAKLGVITARATFTHIYNIREIVNQTFTHIYDIRQTTNQTFTHIYDIRQLVNEDFTHIYDIRQLTNNTFTHIYNIRTPLFLTVDLGDFIATDTFDIGEMID